MAGDNSTKVASRTPYAMKQSLGIRISVSPWSMSRVAKSPRPAPELAGSVKRLTFDIPNNNTIDLRSGIYQPCYQSIKRGVSTSYQLIYIAGRARFDRIAIRAGWWHQLRMTKA